MSGKKSLTFASLVYLVVGLVLLFFPKLTTELFCTVIGVALLLFGGVTILSFFLRRGSDSGFSSVAELVLGVLGALVGLFFLTHPAFLLSIIPTVLGIYIIVDGLVNLKRGLDLRSKGYAGWTTTLVMSIITLVLGALILWNPFAVGLTLWRIVGIAFCYNGISDLLAIHALDKFFKGD